MKHAVELHPDALQALQDLNAAIQHSGLPRRIAELVHLRVSQINVCSTCVDGGARMLANAGETDERLATVAAWRDAPYFSDAERAALELAEVATRLDAGGEAVSDEIWDAARAHYDETQLAALILAIASSNLWNRLNIVIKQVAGAWKP